MKEPSQTSAELSGSVWLELEDRIESFERAWFGGQRPAIGDFLLGDEARDSQLLVELVHTELELRLKSGESPRIEDYVQAFPALGKPEILADLKVTASRIRGGDGAIGLGTRTPLTATRRTDSTAAGGQASRSDQPKESSLPRGEDDRASETRGRNIAGDGRDDVGTPIPGGPFRLGRFEVRRVLGQGSFGVVYLATDGSLDRLAAIKVPYSHILASPELRERFFREGRLAASLDHPNIVPLYEMSEEKGNHYIVSAYCPGPDLAVWLEKRSAPVPAEAAAELILHLAEALEYSHQRGVLHRDVKPANVMLVPRAARSGKASELEFVPRLTDFGLAKAVEMGLTETRSSVVLGTPLYMAPEKVSEAGEAGPEADIYSLGVILYELLCNRPPFTGSLAVVFAKIQETPPEAPRRIQPDIPRKLETICLKCLRKDPQHRYETAGLLAADLRRYLAGDPIKARHETLAERLAIWCRRPARLRDAGILALVINILLVIWTCANHLLVEGLGLPGFDQMDHVRVTIISGLIVLLMHAPMIVAAVQTMRHKRWAVRLGIAFSLVLLTAATAMALELIPYGGLYQDDQLRIQVFTMLNLLFLFQLAAFIPASMALSAIERDGDGG